MFNETNSSVRPCSEFFVLISEENIDLRKLERQRINWLFEGIVSVYELEVKKSIHYFTNRSSSWFLFTTNDNFQIPHLIRFLLCMYVPPRKASFDLTRVYNSKLWLRSVNKFSFHMLTKWLTWNGKAKMSGMICWKNSIL